MPLSFSKVDLGRISSSNFEPDDDRLNIFLIPDSKQLAVMHGYKLDLYFGGESMNEGIFDLNGQFFEHIRFILL